jgi:dTMP kinase
VADEKTYSGVLIAFEGPNDGSRARALDVVANALEAHGQRILVTRWMGSALAGEVYAKSAPLNELSPRTLALLAACDIAERMEWEILPALEAGRIVLADRYLYRVMLGAARDVDPDWLEVLCGAGPVPDAVLRFPVALNELVAKKIDPTNLDLYEAGMDIGMTHDLPLSYRLYQERLDEAYEEWAERHEVALIDLNGPSDALAQVEALLGLKSDSLDRRRLQVLRLLEESGSDPFHARQVTRLARQLFDLTAEQHQLSAEDRNLLEYACLLHDLAGGEPGVEHPSRSARHVRESRLAGFEQSELEMLGVLIAIHRASDEESEVEDWLRALSPELQRRVQLLGPLLRLADGLDAGRRQSVRSINASVHDGLFDLTLRARNRAKLEVKAAVQRADLFEQAYSLHLAIDVDRKGPPPAGADLVAPGAKPWHER